MLALVAVLDGSPRLAVIMLVLAQVIDGLDGPLARHWDIATVLPKYDGYILDLVIDYVTCVLVPAAFAWQFVVVPHNGPGQVAIAAVLATSALWFSRTDMMTDDHWFRGFPAVWNMIIPTLWLFQANHTVAIIVILGLSALSMSDVEFAHPVQVHKWRVENIGFMALWIVVMVALTAVAPDRSVWGDVALLIGPAWVIGSTAVHDIERRRSLVASA